jgi:hypothetical protein
MLVQTSANRTDFNPRIQVRAFFVAFVIAVRHLAPVDPKVPPVTESTHLVAFFAVPSHVKEHTLYYLQEQHPPIV